MDDSEMADYSIQNINTIISDYKTQFDLIKKCSIEQTTKTQKKFDFNELLQKDIEKQVQYIKTLKTLLQAQENEIASLKEKVLSKSNEIVTLNSTIQDKEKEHKDNITNQLFHEESLRTLTQQYQLKEIELNSAINGQMETINELNNKALKWDKIKEKIIQLHNDNKPIMIKATIIQEKEKDRGEPMIDDDAISEMMNSIMKLINKLIEDNKDLSTQIIQNKKIEKEEMKESEQLKELRYENGMLKQQINQLVNENVNQRTKEKNEDYYKKASQDDYLSRELRYVQQSNNTIVNQLSSYKSDMNPLTRLRSKINDLEQRLRLRKELQEKEV